MLALNTWNPWTDLADLHRDLDAIVGRVFQDIGGRSSALRSDNSAVDVRRDGDHWTVVMPVPGIDPSELEIDVDGHQIRVRGEYRGANGTQAGHNTYRGRVDQAITLPNEVDTEKVTARYYLGMLELMLPLKESARPRRIQVQAAPEVKQLQAA
jgi:HSP20 family protein